MQKLHTPDAAHAASLVVEKTDGLISALALVRAIFAAGNVAANAPAANDREPTSDEQAAPGLLDLIRAYKAGMARFNKDTRRLSDEEAKAFAAETYETPYQQLCDWKGAAKTRKEAVEALQLADEEAENGDGDLPWPLLRAARLYFEQERRFDVVDREHVWALSDAASEIGAMIMLIEHTLAVLDEQMACNPDIKYVAALQNALRLMQRRNDYLEEQLHEIACRFSESANGAASRGQ